MPTTFRVAAALGALALAIAAGRVSLAQSPGADESRPVHEVLTHRSHTLMLDYFKHLAATLPSGEQIPHDIQQWEKRRSKLRDRLWRSLGSFPRENRPPLHPQVTGKLDHGDHWVEKVVYQSLPGLYVTALVYVPKNIDGRAPAVLCVNGHWAEAKTTPDIQRRCAGLARMGVIAFCQDVIGTGERAAPPGSPLNTYHGNYRGAVTRIVDRSLLGYVMYECIRSLDYLLTRPDVDPKRIMCTGASGGGKQSMFFPALDDRLAGGVPVCYVSSYHVHMGASACVGEVPTGVLRYTNQWEILGLHAPRPLMCIGASRDTEVFQPRHMLDTLEKTSQRIYRLYGAEANVTKQVVDSGHAYNQPFRELLYNHVAKHLLGEKDPQVVEPEDLPVESAGVLACGLPPESETMGSLTFRRAKEMVGAIRLPNDPKQWHQQKRHMLEALENDVFGGFPDAGQVKPTLVRTFTWKGSRIEHWSLETEPGLAVPAVLCIPNMPGKVPKRPAVLMVDERGKQFTFGRGLVEPLLASGHVVLLIDYRGAGETAGTVPEYPDVPDGNLSNYALFCGRPMTGMRVYDIRCAVDFLTDRPEVDPARIALCGRRIAALSGVLAAAFDERIGAVVAEEMLTTWVFEEEFSDIGLSYLIPRILTVGDITHLAACVAPRPLLILNPIDGRRRAVSAQDARKANELAKSIYALHDGSGQFDCTRCDVNEIPTRLVEWLGEQVP